MRAPRRRVAPRSADDQGDTGPKLVERLQALEKKPGLKPAEYAFQLAGLLHIAAHELRKQQRWQLERDPKWTALDLKPEDVNRLAEITEQLLWALQIAVDLAANADGAAR